MNNFELGKLTDPGVYTDPIDVAGEELELLKEELRDMVLIRKAEEKIGDMIIDGHIECPCHLAIGQEAIAVGVARHLRKTDRAFGTHRSHGQYLATGNSVESLFTEILGKDTGCSKGMGGSMHLYGGTETAFKGSVPIVAGTIPMGVGAALAAKMDQARGLTKDNDVGLAFFGDGAIEEGVVHESMNIASIFRLPMLFVCENNLFSSHLHINLRQPKDMVARFAVAHNIENRVVDGNDIVAVAKAAKELIEYSRAGEGPGFLEVITYRWRGHVGPREDTDVGLHRGEDHKRWKQRDPIRRLHEGLKKRDSQWTDESMAALDQEVQEEVEKAWTRAVEAPFPEVEQLLSAVYASGEVGR